MMQRALLWLCLCLCACAGSRVLVVFPAPGRSHVIQGDSLVDILLRAGHEVTYVTMFPKAAPAQESRLHYINISTSLQYTARYKLNIAHLAVNPRPLHQLLNMGPEFAKQALLHDNFAKLLEDTTTTFDLVIVEWFASSLLAPLAAVYECPLIWYSAMELNWLTLKLMHEPSSAAYSVDMQSREAPALPYTLQQRAYQLWLQIYLGAWQYYVMHFVEEPEYRQAYGPALTLRGRSLPDFESLVYNASLMLLNSHPPLGQRLPLPLSIKEVGGHHIRTPKPLLDTLQMLLDSSSEGVIFFSMGSNLKSKELPEQTQRDLVQMFGQLEQTVVWKFEEKLNDLPPNLHIMEWAPQTSILNHSNTILFISHGGLLSVQEATYFGVPIVGIPFFADQFMNVDLVAARGVGLRVDFTPQLPQKIREAIHEVLTNSSFSIKAKQASATFRHRLATPQEELQHWVQVVLNTEGAPHLRSPALDLPFLEKYHLDILLITASILWFLSKVVKVIRAHMTSDDDEHKKNQ